MNKERHVAIKHIPPSKTKCNAIQTKKDGYCGKKPVAEGRRCLYHGGGVATITQESKDIFKEALTIEDALKLEAFIQDTTSMDGEIAVFKIQIIDEIKTLREAKEALTALLKSAPEMPDNLSETEIEAYKEAGIMHRAMIAEYSKQVTNAKYSLKDLLDKASRAVERNNKVIHGTKYTVTIEQLNAIMIGQMDVMETYCKGCDKLALIAQGLKEIRIKGIGTIPDLNKIPGVKPLPQKVKQSYGNLVRELAETSERVEEAQKLTQQDAEFEEVG